jgi:glycerophosphoryl diester phosphodiesterase
VINPFLTKPNYIRIFGHRGARGDIVENSIEGFQYTFDLGIKALEFDVVISKDNIPVLFHDYNLNPDMVKDEAGQWITDKNIKLMDLTYEEIQKYNIEGLKPETRYAKRFKNQQSVTGAKIPKLTDFFKLVTEEKNKDVFLNLEIKSTPVRENLTTDPKTMVSLILKDIKEYNLEDRTLITSYDWRILYELKKQNPNVLRGFITLQQGLSITKKNIYENSPWMVKNYSLDELFLLPNIIKSLEGHVWSAFYRDVTKQNVELAHNHGLATCVWTVNREQDIIRMIEYGVDGIITDYPKKVQEICKSKNISWF